jgi:hypothetical protein
VELDREPDVVFGARSFDANQRRDEDITEEERERADVVSGGMAIQANRRTTQPKSEPKPKPKKPMRSSQEEYDDDEDDALGGILNLLGLEDDLDDDEQYVRRDSKKDK